MSQPTTPQNGTTKDRAFHKTNVLPPLDVYESSGELLVVVDVPGITADHLSIETAGDAIKFTADVGARVFERTIRIPEGIDAERITAETRNGTVVIQMPKVEAAKPRKIPVRSA